MSNKPTASFDPTVQVVPCGAAVALSKEVLEHGIVLFHPEMPLLKIVLKLDAGKLGYHFIPIQKLNDQITEFAVEVVEPAEKRVKIAEKKLIIPGG